MPESNNTQYLADLSFGLSEEELIKPFLEEHFGKLEKLGKYHPFDYENDDYLIEIKSRRIPHNKYNSLMFNYSKIEKLETYDTDKTAIFVFNCEDGIFCWEYDSSQFTISRGGRCDRGCNEYYTMAYVPIEHLVCLEEMPTFNGFNDSVASLSSSDEEESCCDIIKRKFNTHLKQSTPSVKEQ